LPGGKEPLVLRSDAPVCLMRGHGEMDFWCVFMTPLELFFKDNRPWQSRFRVRCRTRRG
jgi:hypothetical protein